MSFWESFVCSSDGIVISCSQNLSEGEWCTHCAPPCGREMGGGGEQRFILEDRPARDAANKRVGGDGLQQEPNGRIF